MHMRRGLLILSWLGFGSFAGILLLSYLDPITIERAARKIVQIEVERRVGAKVDDLSNSKVVNLAQRALGKTDSELAEAKRALAADVPRRVAEAVANMLNADCECRKRFVDLATREREQRITGLGQLKEHLAAQIHSAYAGVTTKLLRELRIVSSANGLAFASLGIVTFIRRGAALQLLLPAVVLVGAAILTGAIYLFSQNWLHTIVYDQYVGLAYFAYLAVAGSFIADVVFNAARISTVLLNLVLNTVGSAFRAIPC